MIQLPKKPPERFSSKNPAPEEWAVLDANSWNSRSAASRKQGGEVARNYVGMPFWGTKLKAQSDDRSAHRIIIEDTRRLAANEAREISFTRCSRAWYNVSHELAAYGCRTPCTVFWLHSGLDFVVNLTMVEKAPWIMRISLSPEKKRVQIMISNTQPLHN